MMWVQEWFAAKFQDQFLTREQQGVAEQVILREIKNSERFQKKLDHSITRAFEELDLLGKRC